MSADETVVTEALAEHHCHVGPVSGSWVCACGATSTNGSIERGDLTSPAERCAEYHAHVAAVLAPLLQQAREEGAREAPQKCGHVDWKRMYVRPTSGGPR